MKGFRLGGLALSGLLFPWLAAAQVPQLLSYQGRMVVGSSNFNGTGQFKFALVNSNATVSFWSNDGTGAGGAEPTAAVALAVSNGLYAVLLGDTSLLNMTAIQSRIFTNADVRLRIWFNDGVSGSQRLQPDQRLAAVGYAMMGANVEDGVISSNKLAEGAVASRALADLAVTAAKIASNAVGSTQLADHIALGSATADGKLELYRTAAGTPGVTLDGGYSAVAVIGADGLTNALLNGPSYGRLQLYNSAAGNQVAANLSANAAAGGILNLYDTNGNARAVLNGGNTGGYLSLYNRDNLLTAYLDSDDTSSAGYLSLRTMGGLATLALRAQSSVGYGPMLEMWQTNGVTRTVLLDGDATAGDRGGGLWLYTGRGAPTVEIIASEGAGEAGQILLSGTNSATRVELDADYASFHGGYIAVHNAANTRTVGIEGEGANSGARVYLYTERGQSTIRMVASEDPGAAGEIGLYRTNGWQTVQIDGESGTAGGFIEVGNRGAKRTIQLDGDGTYAGGELTIYASNASPTIYLQGTESAGYGGQILMYRTNGTRTVEIDGDSGTRGGYLALYNSSGNNTIALDADQTGASGSFIMRAPSGTQLVVLAAQETATQGGDLSLFRTNGRAAVQIDAENGTYGNGATFTLYSRKGERMVEILANEATDVGGQIELYRTNGTRTVQIDGETGVGGGGYIAVYSSNGTAQIELKSNDGSGDGRITTPVLEITGGSDLSEQFNVWSPAGLPEPGMMVCIDPDRPGGLMISARAYDPTVAGVISGAGGVKPGMLMGQGGSLANGTHPVALSGRVYCLVDADRGAIQPGDLITTSDRLGYGMKAADPERRPGAVIGKAMTGLESGQGLILVLVNLQ